MRDKDTILLEEAYNQILVNELNWKGAAAGLALGALGASNAQATSPNYPQDMDGAGIESRETPEMDASSAVEEIANLLRSKKSFDDIKRNHPNIINPVKERIEMGDQNLAKRLTQVLQLFGTPESSFPDFLKSYYMQNFKPEGA